jgi:hypothetical protein
MNVKELRQALEEAAGILAAAGAKGPSRDLGAFLKLFDGHDDQPVEQFLSDLKVRLDRPAPVPKRERPPDEQTVERYVQRLRQVGTDKILFDSVFAEISNDRAIRKEEADAVAHKYIGGRESWPTKREALEAIKQWFAHLAYQAVKLRTGEKASAFGSR